MELQIGTPFFVRNFVLAISSTSVIHFYFIAQLYTAWRHPGLSVVYKTSLTLRWLEMMENCHLLSMTCRTDKGRGKNTYISVC
jgi:hypothetical protein